MSFLIHLRFQRADLNNLSDNMNRLLDSRNYDQILARLAVNPNGTFKEIPENRLVELLDVYSIDPDPRALGAYTFLLNNAKVGLLDDNTMRTHLSLRLDEKGNMLSIEQFLLSAHALSAPNDALIALREALQRNGKAVPLRLDELIGPPSVNAPIPNRGCCLLV